MRFLIAALLLLVSAPVFAADASNLALPTASELPAPKIGDLFPAASPEQSLQRASVIDATWDLPMETFGLIPGAAETDAERLDGILSTIVDPRTGVVRVPFRDLFLGSAGPAAEIERTYANDLDAGEFGRGFAWTFGTRVVKTGDRLQVREADGMMTDFSTSDGRTFRSRSAAQTVIAKDGGFVRTMDGETERFDKNGRLLERAFADGRKVTVRRDKDGRAVAIASASGRQIKLESDANGRIVSAADEAGRLVRYKYAEDRLVAVNRNGLVVTHTWKDGRLAGATLEDGRALTLEYVENGWVREVRFGRHVVTLAMRLDAGAESLHGARMTVDGETTDYEFDDARGTVRMRGAWGEMTQTLDVDCGCLKSAGYEDGQANLRYDDQGRVKGANRGPVKLEHVYGPNGHIQTIVEAGTSALVVDYDALGNPTRVDGGEHGLVEYGFDKGLPTSIRIDGKDRLLFRYDDRGDLVAIRDASGRVTKLSYDAAGLVRLVERDGHTRVEFASKSGAQVPDLILHRKGSAKVKLGADEMRFLFGETAIAGPKKASLDSIPGVKLAGLGTLPVLGACTANTTLDFLNDFGCEVGATMMCFIPELIDGLSPVGSPLVYENGTIKLNMETLYDFGISWGLGETLGFDPSDPESVAQFLVDQGTPGWQRNIANRVNDNLKRQRALEIASAKEIGKSKIFEDWFKWRSGKAAKAAGRWKIAGRLLKKLGKKVVNLVTLPYKAYQCATSTGNTGANVSFDLFGWKPTAKDKNCPPPNGIDACLTPLPRRPPTIGPVQGGGGGGGGTVLPK